LSLARREATRPLNPIGELNAGRSTLVVQGTGVFAYLSIEPNPSPFWMHPNAALWIAIQFWGLDGSLLLALIDAPGRAAAAFPALAADRDEPTALPATRDFKTEHRHHRR
jgi:hypothetical protein